MKAMGYQALGAQLGEMSEVQQTALLLAFKRKLPVAEAIDLIDTRFKADPRCGHCASKAVGKWASQNGLARYRCKDCGRTFNAPTGTPLAQPHRRDAELAYAQALVDGVWLRKAAARCDIALDTAFRWRHRLLASVKDARPKTVAGVVEVDETFIPKSAKDSKRLAWRAPRKRGTKARSGLSSDDYAPALIVRDRDVATLNHVLTDLESAIFKCILKQVWHPTRCSSATVALSMDGSPRRQASHTSHSMRARANAPTCSYHIQIVNTYISRVKQWMVRFKDVVNIILPVISDGDAWSDAKVTHSHPRAALSTHYLRPQLEDGT